MELDARAEHLVSAPDLARELTAEASAADLPAADPTADPTAQPARAATAPLVVLDVRWRLGDAPGDGARRYAAGHLPGARFLDLEAVLTRHSDDPRDGRHPLPDVDVLAAGLAACGVADGSPVVVYDEAGSFAAERGWWVLRWAGLPARVLDGGIAAWTGAGLRLETGSDATSTRSPDPGPTPRLRLTGGHLPTVDAAAAAAFPAGGVLVDARAGERYRGEVEPLDPRAGHIPGAVNAPAAALFTDTGGLPDDETVRTSLATAGPPGSAGTAGPATGDQPRVAVYCGSGVSATRTLLALAVLGVEGALFPGSWSAWSSDPDRPVATGQDPAPASSAAAAPSRAQTLDSAP